MKLASVTSSTRLVINGASIFGGEAFSRLATAAIALVVARSFGSESLGHYGYALALTSVLLIIPDFGLHLFTVREGSTSPRRISEIFWCVHWLKCGLVVVVVAFAAAFGAWGISNSERRMVFYILIARVLLQTFSHATMAVFKALERMQYVALQQGINSLVVLLWVGVSLAVGARLPLLIAGLVVGQAVETCVGWIILRRVLPIPGLIMWERSQLIRALAECCPIGLTAILLALNLRIDVFVLSRYVPSNVLGHFNAALWFVIATFLAASLLMSVLFPRLSRLLVEGSDKAGAYVSSLVKNTLFITALGALLVWWCAPSMIRLFFGEDFGPAADTLRILAPALPLGFLNTIFFYVFAAAGRRFVCLVTLGFGVVAGTFLSLYMTSRFGVAGCATATVLRELMISSGYLFFLMQANLSRDVGLALLKVFLGATTPILLVAWVAAPLSADPLWWAAWMVLVLAGTMGVLGLPRIGEWRLLTDDRS